MADVRKTTKIIFTPQEVCEALAQYASHRFIDYGPFEADDVSLHSEVSSGDVPYLESASVESST